MPLESMVTRVEPFVDAVIELAPVATRPSAAAVAVRFTAPVPVMSPTEVRDPVTFAVPLKLCPHNVLEVVNEAEEPSILVMPVKL